MSLNLKVSFTATCPGRRVVPVYSPRLKQNGSIELVRTSERDLWSEIQSHAESVDINNIMRRYAAGDVSVLSVTQGVYGDFMSTPRTYAEVLQSVIDGKEFFASLPAEVRNEFGNDFNRFYASTGSEEWYKALSGIVKPPVEPGPIEKEAVPSDVKE